MKKIDIYNDHRINCKVIGDIFGGGNAADAAVEGSRIAADAQREALAYLREREALPTEIRDEALTGLSGYYEVPKQPLGQEELIAQAQGSPLYQQIMGTRQSGEEAILRNASATGGLRSGDAQSALYDYNVQLENDALLQSFNQAQSRDDYTRGMNLQGLTGLAQLQGNENAIAGLTAGIGQTQAQGITAAAQAKDSGIGNLLNTGFQLAGLFGLSDIRLKENVVHVAELNGHHWYTWDWNDKAKKEFDLEGSSQGVMAHEVYKFNPDFVAANDEGYLVVDYGRIANG